MLFSTKSRQFRDMIAEAYLSACRADIEALKPGNVSIYAAGHDMCAEDFIRSAEASVGILVNFNLDLGKKIFFAVRATNTAVGCNTNLGIILLCAPLIDACYIRKPGQSLRETLSELLKQTDVNTANWVYRAIRQASPAGLGQSNLHDIHDESKVSIVEAMQAAVHRDLIALQYVTGYADIFNIALPLLRSYQARFGSSAWAVTGVFLELCSRFPDSHIARKHGMDTAREVRDRVAQLKAEFDKVYSPDKFADILQRIDIEFKINGINPGTTADLTVASILVQHLEELLTTGGKEWSLADMRKERHSRYGCSRCVDNP